MASQAAYARASGSGHSTTTHFSMRDLAAALVALLLLAAAASLATTLQMYRRRRLRMRDSERALGRTIVAEIPAGDDLVLFSEDAVRFHYGEQSVDKDLVGAVRVLINGAPIAAYVSTRHPEARIASRRASTTGPKGSRATGGMSRSKR